MNIRDFKDHLFLSKKAHFLTYVKVAAESIGAPIPEVNFEGCTSFEDELAHIHLDQNKICISESYLKQATDEELRDTATHEVAHLIDETHDISFVKTHINVKTGSWIRKHTSNEINQPLTSDDDKKPIKRQKKEGNFAAVMTNRTLVKLRKLYEGGEIGQDEFLEKIKDELVVVNRIIVRIQNDYESGKMGRRVYLDKLNAFKKDKKELEVILNPPPIEEIPEQLEQIEETLSEPLEPTEETPSKPPEPKEEIEQNNFLDKAGKCDICGEMACLPFECKRCLGTFCDEHHLPENHSCIPINKLIKEFKQFEETTSPKSEEEVIKDKINEVNRIIVRIQNMYENREMARSDYLDKISSFNREKEELEAKLRQFQNIDANIEKERPVNVRQVKKSDYFGNHDDKLIGELNKTNHSYHVDEKYKRESVGNISNKTKYSTPNFFINAKHLLKSKYYRVKKWLNRRNHRRYYNWNTFFMNFIWIVILSISFLIIYPNIEKLNEIILWIIPLGSALFFINGILWIKYTYKFLKRLNYWFKGERNWVRYLTVFVLFLLIWHAYQQNETVFDPIIEFNKNDLSSKFNIPSSTFNFSKLFYIEPEQKNESKDAYVYLNQIRKQNNRRIIEWDDNLYELAVARSKDMYERNYFDHVTPEGKCVKDFKFAYGVERYTIAENLGALYEGYSDIDMSFSKTIEVKEQVDGWMESRGHRYNLMYPDHVKGAIGCYYGVCAFLGANTDPYGLGAGPCTTGDEGLAYWNSVGKQSGEI